MKLGISSPRLFQIFNSNGSSHSFLVSAPRIYTGSQAPLHAIISSIIDPIFQELVKEVAVGSINLKPIKTSSNSIYGYLTVLRHKLWDL